MRMLESGVGLSTDRLGGLGNDSATAGIGIGVRPVYTGFPGITASKLGTDVPPQESLSPGESIAP
jgi:hypothetical protein